MLESVRTPAEINRDIVREYERWAEELSDVELLHQIRLRKGAAATTLRRIARERNLL